MTHRKYLQLLSILFFLFGILGGFMMTPSSSYAAQWRTRAGLDVPARGVVDTVVAPGLVAAKDSGTYDLHLTGPDGKPRAFELYWRDRVARIRQTLTPGSVRLTKKQGFVWEADIPPGIVMDHLEVQLAEREHIGRMDVEGLKTDGWVMLARDAAVYHSDNKASTKVAVDSARYEKIRLSLTGYDKRAKSALSPIREVVIGGQHPGKDFTRESISIGFEPLEQADHLDLQASLPGTGLFIESLIVRTQAQFMGEWQLGHYHISEGRKRFTTVIEGSVPHMGEEQQALRINVQRQWPERQLVLRLFRQDRFIGEIMDLTARVRLPRLVFAADLPGRYTAHTGMEKRVRVFSHPGRAGGEADLAPYFGTVETNPQWRIETLVERYQLKGGPFDPGDYAWKSLIAISHPGYYRLRLHPQAGLDSNPKGVRLIRDGIQVPFFFGPDELREIGLQGEAQYDAKTNRTAWTVHLSHPSAQWQYIELRAAGIFKREVALIAPEAVGPSRKKIHRTIWEHRGEGPALLRLPIKTVARDYRSFEIVMEHGDNQPIELDEIHGYFRAPVLYFLAHSAGEYDLFGGHPTAEAPRYDLSLVQDELLAALPDTVEMGEPLPLGVTPQTSRIVNYFKETNAGLYAVLALVTLVLIVIVVRLLPKPVPGEDTDSSK